MVMKNVHLIQTDKLSRLGRFIDTNNLFLRTTNDIPRGEDIDIYITSDEEIKDGDWMIRGNEQPILVTPNFFWDFGVRYYKIILTTDQDLIKDGVQAIDDEFLGWFVKNPSCESVKVKLNYLGSECLKCGYIENHDEVDTNCCPKCSNTTYKHLYENKIIIPREETKCYCGHTTYCDCGPEEPKQETLEEVAKRIYGSELSKDVEYYAFISGANWQAERMYSEEDLISFAHFYFQEEFNSSMQTSKSTKDIFTQWFEQFKKK